MENEAWYRDKIIEHARELGASEARHEAQEAAITKLGETMEKGFVKLEGAQERGLNHVRGEIVALRDDMKAQRAEDLRATADLFNELRADQQSFQVSNQRAMRNLGVALALVSAVVGAVATGAQVALNGPAVAAAAGAVLEHIGP